MSSLCLLCVTFDVQDSCFIKSLPFVNNQVQELYWLDRGFVGEFQRPVKCVYELDKVFQLCKGPSSRRQACRPCICVVCVYISLIEGSFSQVHEPLGCRCYLKTSGPWEHLISGENVHHWIQKNSCITPVLEVQPCIFHPVWLDYRQMDPDLWVFPE